MADRFHNETMEEQRRARQKFLELKKMQSGETAPEPKPSETAIVPKTFSEKVQNFWYHYKWHTLGIAALVAIIAIMVTQCVNREKFDLEIIVFSYSYLNDAQIDYAEEYFEQFIDDIDGDGKVNIGISNCSFSESSATEEYRRTMMTKIQARLAADAKTMLFITDDQGYEYLNGIASGTAFEEKRIPLGDGFYAACNQNKDYTGIPEGLTLICRNVEGTAIARDKDAAICYRESQKIMDAMQQDAPQEN